MKHFEQRPGGGADGGERSAFPEFRVDLAREVDLSGACLQKKTKLVPPRLVAHNGLVNQLKQMFKVLPSSPRWKVEISCLRVIIAVIKYNDLKQVGEKRVCFCSYVHISDQHCRKDRTRAQNRQRTLEPGADAEAMGEG